VPAPLRRPLVLLAATLAAATLASCGAGPREASTTTVDAIVADRGVLVGADGDRAPGVRALNARQAKPIARFQSDFRSNLFGDGGKVTLIPFLNGVAPLKEAVDLEKEGAPDLVYAGDRIGWVVRDVSDPAKAPSAIVGLFPAPFSTRFTKKRRLIPTRLQCATVGSPACEALEKTFVKLGLKSATSNLQDTAGLNVIRVYAGPWTALRGSFERGRLNAALGVEGPAEANGFGFEVGADGKSVRVAAKFGESVSTAPLGAGTGFVFAIRDAADAPAWIVSGTDDAGVLAAVGALDQAQLAGRVSAVIPPR
jgi:hypothetical protein